jgi:hypothetical protein
VSQAAHRPFFPRPAPPHWIVFSLTVLLLALAVPGAQARVDSLAAISFAEQPVRLLRATTFYLAARGTRLQDGDIVETGSSAIQIDGDGAATLAIGPASRVYFKFAGGALSPNLLTGWLKIQPGASANPAPATVSSGPVQFNANGIVAILHADADKTELFVETGVASVVEKVGAKTLAPFKVGPEQFAVRSVSLPLKLQPRAPREFISAMPPTFFDKLVTVPVRGAAPAPKLDRPALFADVAPWLAADSALLQLVERRFNPAKVAPPPPPRPESHLY